MTSIENLIGKIAFPKGENLPLIRMIRLLVSVVWRVNYICILKLNPGEKV